MSAVNTSSNYITLAETYFGAAASNGLGNDLAAVVNLLFQNAQQQGVGSLIQNRMTETQLQAVRGAGWILADGRNVSGSAYQTLTGSTTVPDLRGTFLRGKNNGRSDGKQNPDGEITPGVTQSAVVGSHTHAYDTDGTNIAANNGTTDQNVAGGAQPNFTPTLSGRVANSAFMGPIGLIPPSENDGGGIARPKSVTLNCFIRIN